MAKSVATLSVKITGDSAKFNRSLKQANRQLQHFANTALKWSARASAATAAGMALAARSSFALIDANAKLADRLNATTEELVGLHRASELTGLGTENLDRALEAMVRRLGQAVHGTGEGRRALDALNLSAQELVHLPLAQQLGLIADRINGLSTQAERSAAAADLFSDVGKRMANFLALGSKGMSEAQRQAEALGETYTRLQAGAVERANDALRDLAGASIGVANKLAIKLAPTVEAATRNILRFYAEHRRAAEVLGEWTGRLFKATAALTAAVYGLRALRTAAKSARAAIVALTVATDTLSSKQILVLLGKIALTIAAAIGLTELFDLALGSATSGAEDLAKQAEKTREATDAAADAASEVADGFERARKASEGLQIQGQVERAVTGLLQTRAELRGGGNQALGLLRARAQVGDISEATLRFAERIQADIDAMKRRDKLLEDQQRLEERGNALRERLLTPLERMKESIAGARELYDAGAVSLETFRRATDDARKRFDEATGLRNRASRVRAGAATFGEILSGNARRLGTQQVRDPQLEETNERLRSIDRKVGREGVFR